MLFSIDKYDTMLERLTNSLKGECPVLQVLQGLLELPSVQRPPYIREIRTVA